MREALGLWVIDMLHYSGGKGTDILNVQFGMLGSCRLGAPQAIAANMRMKSWMSILCTNADLLVVIDVEAKDTVRCGRNFVGEE